MELRQATQREKRVVVCVPEWPALVPLSESPQDSLSADCSSSTSGANQTFCSPTTLASSSTTPLKTLRAVYC